MMILHTFDNTYSDGTTYRQFLQTTDDPLEALQLAPPDSDREDLESFLWDLFEQSHAPKGSEGNLEDEETRRYHEETAGKAGAFMIARDIEGFLHFCEETHKEEEEVEDITHTIYGEWTHDTIDLNAVAGSEQLRRGNEIKRLKNT